MNSKPLVSIACICYNHAPYIAQCLDGFLSQKVNFPIEIVIYDDASSDGTREILQEYQSKHPDLFHLYLNEENQYSKGVRGITYRYNFPRCRGKYIALCEGDDYWSDPEKLQKQVDFLESNRNYTATVHMAVVFNQNTGKSEDSVYSHVDQDFDLRFSDILKYQGGVYPTCSLLMRKDKVLLPDNLLYFTGADLIFIIFLVLQGKVRYMKEKMSVYRIQSGGVYQGEKKDISFYIRNRRNLEYFYKALSQHLELKYQLRVLLFRIKNFFFMTYLRLKMKIS
jgi:glycosyltransferase involved in cell wall biosynthesis